MPDISQTYTYRNGVKVPLEVREDQLVVRALPEELAAVGIEHAEQVSSNSSRIAAPPATRSVRAAAASRVGRADPAYYEADSGQEFLPTERIIVTFKSAPSDEEYNAFVAKYALLEREKYSERDYLFQMTADTGLDPVALVVTLMEDEELVENADHDLNYRADMYAAPIPTDPKYAQQWHLHTHFIDPQVDPRSSSRCEDAWQLLDHYGDPDVVIGVSDDGCLLQHQDFDSAGKFAGWGYFRGTSLITRESIGADPDQMYQSGSNHGTACAGVIAGEADAVLTVGAAPDCRLLPVKWESDGPSLFISDSKLLTALNYMADKVDVMSNSWGIVPRSDWSSVVKRRIAELAATGGRRGKGIVFLWAAGNENCPFHHNAGQDTPYTSGWSNGRWVGVRTARVFSNGLVGIPGVMHVAALASNAQRSHYSNYGTGIGICAPTNNVHEYRRIRVTGLGITTTTGPASDVTTGFGGTSSATPLVAGVVGLVISANPGLAALEVISVLKRTAAKDLNFEGYPQTPPALFNDDTSWDVSPVAPFNDGAFQDIGSPDGTWSPWFGHGRVDASAAVAEAIRLRGGEPGNGETSEIRFASSPNLAIPDNDQNGVHDVIHVNKDGKLADIAVSVKIQHSWIGDLSVTLGAPDGTSVILHQRAGASQDNLETTYTPSQQPALAALHEKNIGGDWTLHVRDLAPRDTGVLQDWALAFKIQPVSIIVAESEAVAIPDNDPAGITRSLSIAEDVQIRDIGVSVDITHTWIGDLTVAIVPPGGNEILLHNRAGRDADNLIKTWRSAEVVGLQALRGSSAAGTWRLKVADLAGRDVGKLNRWQIEATV